MDGECKDPQLIPCPEGQTRNPNTGICESPPVCNPGETQPCVINGIPGTQTCI